MNEKRFFFFFNKNTAPLKDAAIFAGWIAGLILIAGLAWFFTQPVRGRVILASVNNVLERSSDPRRLAAPITTALQPTGASRAGLWFAAANRTSEKSFIFIFAFIAEGTFFPCAAVVSARGEVQEFIPLSVHGERVLRRISPGIQDVYKRRIVGGHS
ncbi:MAG: hypothetical protein FWD91_02810 [Treponema sp.]|nr:hypothetical protein [Treponema sp.]